MSRLTDWLWLIISGVLAVLWLWTLMRYRKERSTVRSSRPQTMLQRMEAEDLLKTFHNLQAKEGSVSIEELAHATQLPEAVVREEMATLFTLGWVERDSGDELRLTDEGTQRARDLIRAHRLWERYLVDREGMALDAVHAEAHRREHDTTAEELERLDAELEHPAWDPHGHVIPAPSSKLPATGARSLLDEGAPGSRFRIVELDDEPSELLAQLVILGLRPGMEIEVRQRDPTFLQVQLDDSTVPLANAAARRILVVPTPALAVPLGELPVGVQARVIEIRGSGKHQRRVLDMGFVPGAEIGVMRTAPLGDPVEYRVKETAVALRKEDADTILVEELRDEEE